MVGEKAGTRLNYEFIVSGEDLHGDGAGRCCVWDNLGTKLGSIRKLSLPVYRSSNSVRELFVTWENDAFWMNSPLD